MPHETRAIPAAAFNLAAGPATFAQAEKPGDPIPVTLTARSGQPIEHWFWGRVVHDLAGMRLDKPAIALDYAHEEGEVIGYAAQFDTTSGDLVAKGFLIPFAANDRASEIAFKARQGVPYESSINFGGDGIKIEEVAEGQVTAVNGYTLEGPACVIREWPLRGIAICPYGADANTPVELAAGNQPTILVNVQRKETAMAEAPADPKTDDPITEPETTPPAATPDPASPAEPKPEEEPAAQLSTAPAKTGPDFLAAFGDQGGVWFAQGKTFEEATQLQIAQLTAENRDLRARLAAMPKGETPAKFQPAPDQPREPKTDQHLAHLGQNLSRFAAGVKLPVTRN